MSHVPIRVEIVFESRYSFLKYSSRGMRRLSFPIVVRVTKMDSSK